MKKFDILRYINKGKIWIILAAALAGLLFYFMQSQKQTYIARTLIEYTYSGASSGETPNGGELDVSEVKSTIVLQRTISQLNLPATVDEIRSALTYEGILSSDEAAMKQALLADGKEYNKQPTRYLITYEVGSTKSTDYARSVLDAVISNYITYFGEKYVSTHIIPNNAAAALKETYDYLEKVDLMNDHITAILEYMDGKGDSFMSFHCASIDCPFQVLYDQYEFIQKNELPYMYIDIFENKLSTDLDLLLATYRQRVENGQVEINYNSNAASGIKETMDQFSQKNKESIGKAADSVGNSYSYILQNVYENEKENVVVDRTTTYDILIEEYTSYLISAANLKVDGTYYSYIINTFTNKAKSLSEEEKKESERKIALSLQNISEKLDTLYQKLMLGVNEYNAERGSSKLRMRTNVSVTQSMNIKRYAIIIVFVFGVLTSGVVIVIGRVADFVDYTFWIDHVTGLPNRRRCDQYIEERSKTMLQENFACLMLKLLNLRDINSRFGHEGGNQTLTQIADTLRHVMPKEAALFYNGNETFICFVEQCTHDRAVHLLNGISQQINAMNEERRDLDVQIKTAMTESTSEKVFNIRAILSATFKKM
ncbi:MAG: diguanylate cyclase [Clostridia bacterium]|nr:diguanylate cyclase [Clostridia bacterium]